MAEYLGETNVPLEDSPYKDYDKTKWALYYITRYGGFDGDHHKDWVLDQVARILHGAVPKIKLAKWSDGQTEYRLSPLKTTPAYVKWVKEITAGEDGPDTYEYSIGIAP